MATAMCRGARGSLEVDDRPGGRWTPPVDWAMNGSWFVSRSGKGTIDRWPPRHHWFLWNLAWSWAGFLLVVLCGADAASAAWQGMVVAPAVDLVLRSAPWSWRFMVDLPQSVPGGEAADAAAGAGAACWAQTGETLTAATRASESGDVNVIVDSRVGTGTALPGSRPLWFGGGPLGGLEPSSRGPSRTTNPMAARRDTRGGTATRADAS